jgi:hypothetical protein
MGSNMSQERTRNEKLVGLRTVGEKMDEIAKDTEGLIPTAVRRAKVDTNIVANGPRSGLETGREL